MSALHPYLYGMSKKLKVFMSHTQVIQGAQLPQAGTYTRNRHSGLPYIVKGHDVLFPRYDPTIFPNLDTAFLTFFWELVVELS